MAKQVLTGVFLSINAVTLHNLGSVMKAELKKKSAELDATSYASGGDTEVLGGLRSGTLECEFFNDFAAGQIDSLMDALLGQVVPFEIRPTQAATSAGNPKRTGSILIAEWNPIEGGVGELATVKVSFPTSGATPRSITP